MEEMNAKSIHVLTVGPFGQAAGIVLRDLLPRVALTHCTAHEGMNSSYWPDACLRLVVSWRPSPALLELVNRLSFAWNIPFIPAVLDGPELVIGPVTIPGLSACHRCYERRVLQHCTRPEARAALLRHYDSNPESGPEGHLDVFADLAAARLAQLVGQVQSAPDQIAGKIWQFDLIRRLSTMSTVVGVHGCPYCGLQRDERSRSYSMLRAEVEALLRVKPDRELTTRWYAPEEARI